MSTDPETPTPPPAEDPTPEVAPQEPAPPAPPAPAAPGAKSEGAEKKLVAGILAILLGSLGIHKFYLGYQKEGLIMLLVTVLSCFFASPIISIIGIVEGIMYLTKSDDEFVATYITNQKGWF